MNSSGNTISSSIVKSKSVNPMVRPFVPASTSGNLSAVGSVKKRVAGQCVYCLDPWLQPPVLVDAAVVESVNNLWDCVVDRARKRFTLQPVVTDVDFGVVDPGGCDQLLMKLLTVGEQQLVKGAAETGAAETGAARHVEHVDKKAVTVTAMEAIDSLDALVKNWAKAVVAAKIADAHSLSEGGWDESYLPSEMESCEATVVAGSSFLLGCRSDCSGSDATDGANSGVSDHGDRHSNGPVRGAKAMGIETVDAVCLVTAFISAEDFVSGFLNQCLGSDERVTQLMIHTPVGAVDAVNAADAAVNAADAADADAAAADADASATDAYAAASTVIAPTKAIFRFAGVPVEISFCRVALLALPLCIPELGKCDNNTGESTSKVENPDEQPEGGDEKAANKANEVVRKRKVAQQLLKELYRSDAMLLAMDPPSVLALESLRTR
jgi:hypothetical protein